MRGALAAYEQLGVPIVSSRLLGDGSFFRQLTADSAEHACTLKLNNLSKIDVPAFGRAGTRASRVLCTAGPTLLLPAADGGLRCYLSSDRETIGEASAAQVEAALLAPPASGEAG